MNEGTLRRLIAALSLSLLLAGCGVPGDPLPPLLELPAPVQDLQIEQAGAQLRLTWTPPAQTTEGTQVRSIRRIEIYAAFLPPGTALTDVAAQTSLLKTFSAADSSGALSSINQYTFPVPANDRGRHAFVALKVFNRRGKDAGFSNIASAEVADLPEAPANLTAALTESTVELKWTPAQRSAFGGPPPTPDGYEIYRGEAGSSAPPQVIGTSTVPSYHDRTFVFGAKYVYVVRAFTQAGESTARTPESNRVEVAAVDTFPPAAPQNLRAIGVPGAVELAWSPNDEPGLAGYNVYRADGGAFTRLNNQPLALPLYRDTSARPGAEQRYVVRAVDKAGNESAPSAESSAAPE